LGKEYSNIVITNARQLQELFPGKDLKFYCETIEVSGEKTPFEEIIENFIEKN